MLAETEKILKFEGPHTVAAIILETVVGTNGILVPPDGYLKGVREICDRHDVLFVSDETICGFGRIGEWFGIQRYDVVPDVITCAKGMSSGYAPIGAMIAHDRHHIAEISSICLLTNGLVFCCLCMLLHKKYVRCILVQYLLL